MSHLPLPDLPTPAAWLIEATDGSAACVTLLSHAAQSLMVTSRERSATVKLWLYRPQFGVKVVVYPPLPEAMTYPNFLGPNQTATAPGLVVPPATVAGTPVSGAHINLTAPDISTTLNIGVTPYGGGG